MNQPANPGAARHAQRHFEADGARRNKILAAESKPLAIANAAGMTTEVL